MKKQSLVFLFLILSLAAFQLAMGNRSGQYDEEAREAERQEKLAKKAGKAERHPVKNFAGGVKQATVDSTTGLIEETSQGTAEDAPVVGTLEGARRGSEKVLDNTVRGAVKVATLGYGHVDHYEVQEPEKNSDEPTKIKLKF